MKIKRVNKTSAQVLEIENGEVLISYSTPVAARIIGECGAIWYKTDKRWSTTTSKHIGQFLPKGINIEVMPQDWFDKLITIGLSV